MGMTTSKCIVKAGFLIASISLFVCMLFTSNALAQDNHKHKGKDPELVAFYEYVFGKEALAKHYNTKSKKQNSVKPKKKPLPSKQKALLPKQIVTHPKKAKTAPESTSQEIPKSNKVVNTHDTAALFEKAFGKKTNVHKQESNKENVNNATVASNDMSALFAKAFGKKAAIAAPPNVNVDLSVNKRVLGDITLFSNEQNIIDRLDTKKLLSLLEDVLKEHVFKRVNKQLEKDSKTTFVFLNTLGITAYYNQTNLSLDVTVKPELRKPQIFSFMKKREAQVREENRIKAEADKISGYINTYTNVGFNSQDNDYDLRMRLEGSLNIHGAVLETTADYRDEKLNHSKTTLTYDKPEKLQRFILGNISTGNRNFQENLELDGIKVSKEFFLDPNLQITPRANESIVLDTDSEIELFINNQLIRRIYLKAGIHSLQDIGLYDGANNIRIRITDEFGKVTVKTSKQYYDSHLLNPGLSLFALSVGYLSNQQADASIATDKSPLLLSAYYQKGISEDLTLSLDAQLSPDNYLLGFESISSTPLGSIKNSFASSGGENRNSGYATSFEFRPNKKQELIGLDTLRQDLLGLDTRSKGLINSWSITGEYRSEDFLLLSAGDTFGNSSQAESIFESRVLNNDKLRGYIQTNLDLNLQDKWHGTLNLGVSDYYESTERVYANLSATRRFDNGMRLSIGGRYDTNDEFSMNLQLTIPLTKRRSKRRVELDLLADARDSSYETKLTVKPNGMLGQNSLGASLEHVEDKGNSSQHLNLQYRDTYFETKLSARNNQSKFSGEGTQQLNLGFNTAIACIGEHCASSYPISDSFALVEGPSNQERPIAISNTNVRFRYSDGNDTGLPDNYTALIPKKGRKAVVRLESYRTQNINIDEGTLPIGYDAEKTEFSVFPKYHQGFMLKAGGEPSTIIDGMLYDEQKKALPYKGGQWISQDEGKKAVAFFSNKSGRFRVNSIDAGKYKLELFDYPDMESIMINVPNTKGKIHELGNLIIKTPN